MKCKWAKGLHTFLIIQKATPHLQNLVVTRCKVTDASLSLVHTFCPSIQFLSCGVCEITGINEVKESIEHSDVTLDAISKLTNLLYLGIAKCMLITTPGALKIVARCKLLQILSLSECNMDDSLLDTIAANNVTYLSTLVARKCKFSGTTIKKFRKECPDVELDVS